MYFASGSPYPSERAFGYRDHVARLHGIIRSEIAALQDLVEAHRIRARRFAFLAVKLGAAGRCELVRAAGGEHGVEHGHALAERHRDRLAHRARDTHAREVFVAAKLCEDDRDLRIADV